MTPAEGNTEPAVSKAAPEPAEVEEGVIIVRMLPPGTVDPAGIIQASAITPVGASKPGDTGPSVYALVRLVNGIADLEAANPKWASFGYATCSAADLRAKGLRLVYTPKECPFESVAHAHVSISNLTRQLRAEILPLLQRGCARLPVKKA